LQVFSSFTSLNDTAGSGGIIFDRCSLLSVLPEKYQKNFIFQKHSIIQGQQEKSVNRALFSTVFAAETEFCGGSAKVTAITPAFPGCLNLQLSETGHMI